MDHLSIADVHDHMINIPVFRVKDQVPGKCFLHGYSLSRVCLVCGHPGDIHAKIIVKGLYKTGAVRAVCQACPTPDIGIPHKLKGIIDQRRAHVRGVDNRHRLRVIHRICQHRLCKPCHLQIIRLIGAQHVQIQVAHIPCHLPGADIRPFSLCALHITEPVLGEFADDGSIRTCPLPDIQAAIHICHGTTLLCGNILCRFCHDWHCCQKHTGTCQCITDFFHKILHKILLFKKPSFLPAVLCPAGRKKPAALLPQAFSLVFRTIKAYLLLYYRVLPVFYDFITISLQFSYLLPVLRPEWRMQCLLHGQPHAPDRKSGLNRSCWRRVYIHFW